jgi:CubicO group peptidase (beta-lactamase class C family)
MQTRLCEPLGMEATGYWIVDSLGREMAYAGLLLTARDFARIGELYRNGGLWQGRRVVPADYVAASITADAPHLQPGAPWVGDHVFGPGYGYQWWLPAGGQGDFSAIGVCNQYVYVDPARGTVIVKLSANPAYGTSTSEATNRDNRTSRRCGRFPGSWAEHGHRSRARAGRVRLRRFPEFRCIHAFFPLTLL